MTDKIDPNNATESGKPEGQPTEPRTFTQSELDTIVADRLKREKEKYIDYADLKKKAEQWTAFEEAQKTELQKAQEAMQKALSERDQALARANERMKQAKFIEAAAALNVAHPEDAYALANMTGVSITDDGQVIGVAEAVKILVEAGRLPLTTRPKAPSLDGGAGGGEPNTDRQAELTESERQAALKMGIKPEDYAKSKIKKE